MKPYIQPVLVKICRVFAALSLLGGLILAIGGDDQPTLVFFEYLFAGAFGAIFWFGFGEVINLLARTAYFSERSASLLTPAEKPSAAVAVKSTQAASANVSAKTVPREPVLAAVIITVSVVVILLIIVLSQH